MEPTRIEGPCRCAACLVKQATLAALDAKVVAGGDGGQRAAAVADLFIPPHKLGGVEAVEAMVERAAVVVTVEEAEAWVRAGEESLVAWGKDPDDDAKYPFGDEFNRVNLRLARAFLAYRKELASCCEVLADIRRRRALVEGAGGQPLN